MAQVVIAALSRLIKALCSNRDNKAGWSIWPATLLTVAIAFAFHLLALFRGWEELEPWEPPEVQAGENPRPLLGDSTRKEFEGNDGCSSLYLPT